MREGCLARYSGVAQLPLHLQSLEVYTFGPLILRVPANLPTDEPQHAHQAALNQSEDISIPDWHTIDMSQAILRLR